MTPDKSGTRLETGGHFLAVTAHFLQAPHYSRKSLEWEKIKAFLEDPGYQKVWSHYFLQTELGHQLHPGDFDLLYEDSFHPR